MALFRRTALKAAEADLASLTTRHEGILSRLAEATVRAAAAAAEQRRLLIDTDGSDAAAIKKAGDACRARADDKAALEDAARTLASMIDGAAAKLAAEHDQIERNRLSGEINAKADRLAGCLAAEAKAITALAEAHQNTRMAAYAALPDLGRLSGADVLIGEVKAISLHLSYPQEYHAPPFLLSRGEARATINGVTEPYVASLRAQAAAILSGETPLPVAPGPLAEAA